MNVHDAQKYGLIIFDTELRLVRALREPAPAPEFHPGFIRGDHFAHATIAQHFQAYEGQPLTIPAEAAGPKPEYLAWHREEVFGK